MKKDTIIPGIKLGLLVFLAVLGVVLILQNTQVVTMQLLFITVGMPLAILLAVPLLVGFTVGVIAALKMGPLQDDKRDESP